MANKHSTTPRPVRRDLTGQTFGRLTVIKMVLRTAQGCTRTHWRCRCVCGNEVTLLTNRLLNKGTKSCGCLKRDSSRQRHTTHGKSKLPEFSVWCAMRKRCYNPNNTAYKNYGGRGINVCRQWLGPNGFPAFLSDMGNRPSPQHTIDRIDNDGNYCPDNCRWATRQEQAANNRRNIVISYEGKSMILQDWANYLHLHRCTIERRLAKGWALSRVLAPR